MPDSPLPHRAGVASSAPAAGTDCARMTPCQPHLYSSLSVLNLAIVLLHGVYCCGSIAAKISSCGVQCLKVGTAAKLATGQRARQFKGRGYTVQRERGRVQCPLPQ